MQQYVAKPPSKRCKAMLPKRACAQPPSQISPQNSTADIKSVFRIIPVHSDDHPLLGMKWENLYLYDCWPPMGCLSSCDILEAFDLALRSGKHPYVAWGPLAYYIYLTTDATNFLSMITCQFIGFPCPPPPPPSENGFNISPTFVRSTNVARMFGKCWMKGASN